jgi:hypothetical protein
MIGLAHVRLSLLHGALREWEASAASLMEAGRQMALGTPVDDVLLESLEAAVDRSLVRCRELLG